MNNDQFWSAVNIHEASKTLSEEMQKVFILFMIKRFHSEPNYTHINYAMEWANRFKDGQPEGYMDGYSKRVYQEVQA